MTVRNIYFNGTNETAEIPRSGQLISLATVLHEMTTDSAKQNVPGCAVDNPDVRDLGQIFTFNLTAQVKQIAHEIEQELASSSKAITLNIYGFSRGAVAAFLVAQLLKHIPKDRLIINIVAIDPVPGNFITTVHGDLILGVASTLSAAVADLSECNNIGRLLILFTNEHVDAVCHAPILPTYPKLCHAEIDVTPGCHSTAVAFININNFFTNLNQESAVVFYRVIEFMQKCGTTLDLSKFKLTKVLRLDSDISINQNHNLKTLYSSLLQNSTNDSRVMHLYNMILTRANKLYLNHHHQKLCDVVINDETCALTIQKRNPERVTPNSAATTQIVGLILTVAIAAVMLRQQGGSQDNNRPRFK